MKISQLSQNNLIMNNTSVVSRPIRWLLPLIASFFLAACDSALLFPPDARLPDGSTYSGDIQDGMFQGHGVQKFPSGMIYRGEFQDGYWHGQGELESPADWRYAGDFQKGAMAGHGVHEHRKARYEGEFRNDLYHGHGRYEIHDTVYLAKFVDGEPVRGQHITEYGTYEGEFSDWDYHGEGTFTRAGDGDVSSISGRWENGFYMDAEERTPRERSEPRTEQILVEDRQRLLEQIAALQPSRTDERDVYFLAVGGDGNESVFMRDIEVARAGVQGQFDLVNRSIMLLNHRDYEHLPLATRPSIAKALQALDERMNPEHDLLIVHLVSHGSRVGELTLRQPGLLLPGLTPEDFADMWDSLNVRHRVLVVSACYAGHWLNELQDEHTLIMASARDDRQSFGCGDDSEMTWFSKAVYQSAGFDLSDPDALFEEIDQQIRIWEEEIGMEEERWSYPQFHLGDGLRAWLSQHKHVSAERELASRP